MAVVNTTFQYNGQVKHIEMSNIYMLILGTWPARHNEDVFKFSKDNAVQEGMMEKTKNEFVTAKDEPVDLVVLSSSNTESEESVVSNTKVSCISFKFSAKAR